MKAISRPWVGRVIDDAIGLTTGFPALAAAYALDRLRRRSYAAVDEAQVRATRASDTVFVFGSGYSLQALTPDEWRAIERYDTISFRDFARQSFIRVGYHLTGEVDDLAEYARRLRENPLYAQAVFVVQEGWRALMGNRLIGRRLLPADATVFRYRRTARGRYAPYSRSFHAGLVHGHGSVVGVVNFAYLMGWSRIVLAGIDLNDKRYFWLGPDETRSVEKPGLTYADPFPAADAIVEMLGRWREDLNGEGVELFVLNPNSRLAEVLPVFARAELAAAGSDSPRGPLR